MVTSCPECGYSWEGLPDGGKCPECGFPRGADLRVWKQSLWSIWWRPVGGVLIMIGQGMSLVGQLHRIISNKVVIGAPDGYIFLICMQGILAAAGLLIALYTMRPACRTRYVALDRDGLNIGDPRGRRGVLWSQLRGIRQRYFITIHVDGERPIVFQKPAASQPTNDFVDVALARWEDWRMRQAST